MQNTTYIAQVIEEAFRATHGGPMGTMEAVVVLRCGKELVGAVRMHVAAGVLGLKMMVPISLGPGKANMMEGFFSYEDVAMFGVMVTVVPSAPRIVT